jgi:hypothetical protein
MQCYSINGAERTERQANLHRVQTGWAANYPRHHRGSAKNIARTGQYLSVQYLTAKSFLRGMQANADLSTEAI